MDNQGGRRYSSRLVIGLLSLAILGSVGIYAVASQRSFLALGGSQENEGQQTVLPDDGNTVPPTGDGNGTTGGGAGGDTGGGTSGGGGSTGGGTSGGDNTGGGSTTGGGSAGGAGGGSAGTGGGSTGGSTGSGQETGSSAGDPVSGGGSTNRGVVERSDTSGAENCTYYFVTTSKPATAFIESPQGIKLSTGVKSVYNYLVGRGTGNYKVGIEQEGEVTILSTEEVKAGTSVGGGDAAVDVNKSVLIVRPDPGNDGEYRALILVSPKNTSGQIITDTSIPTMSYTTDNNKTVTELEKISGDSGCDGFYTSRISLPSDAGRLTVTALFGNKSVTTSIDLIEVINKALKVVKEKAGQLVTTFTIKPVLARWTIIVLLLLLAFFAWLFVKLFQSEPEQARLLKEKHLKRRGQHANHGSKAKKDHR